MPPRRNYNFEKRQKDQARKDKKAEKLQRKRDRAAQRESGDATPDDQSDEAAEPADADPTTTE